MKINRYVLLVGILAILAIFHGWFLNGYVVGGDFRIRTDTFFIDFYKHVSIWSNSMFGGFPLTVNGYINKFPLYFISGGLAHYGVDYYWIQRIVYLYPTVIIGFFSFFTLSRYLFKDKNISFTLSVLFLLNPVLLEMIFRSHMWFSLVYAITPLFIYYGILSLKNKEKKNIVFASIIAATMFVIEPRIALLHSIVSFIIICILSYGSFQKKDLGKMILYGTLFTVLLSSFWLIPLAFEVLMYKTEVIGKSIQAEGFIKSSARNFGGILNGITFMPKGFNNGIFFGVVFLFVSGYIFLKTNIYRDKKVLLLLLTMLICIFLSKGIFAPLGGINFEILSSNGLFAAYKNTNKFALIGYITFLLILGFTLSKVEKKREKLLIALLLLGLLKNFFILEGYFNRFGIGQEGGFKKYFGEQNMYLPRNKNTVTVYNSYFKSVEASSIGYKTLWLPTIHDYRYTSNLSPYLNSSGFYNNKELLGDFFNGPNGYLTDEFIILDRRYLQRYFCNIGIDKIILKAGNEKEWGYVKGQDFELFHKFLSQKFTHIAKLGNGANVYSAGCNETNDNTILNSSLLGSPHQKIYTLENIEQSEISLNTSYHKGWGLYIQETEERNLNIPAVHSIKNNYSNSWNINKKLIKEYVENNFGRELKQEGYPLLLTNGKKDFKYYTENKDGTINVNIVAYFKPQQHFILGIYISSITLVILILWLLMNGIGILRRKKRK